MIAQDGSQVSIQPVTRDNWRRLLALRVRPDQQRFVADYAPIVLVILAKAQVGAAGLTWWPHAIYEDDTPVGAFALAAADHQPSDRWFFHFFVDEEQQRRGVGARALDLVLDAVAAERPPVERILLTVHPENEAARRLYESRGFVATGARQDGEDILSLSLSAASPDVSARRGARPAAWK